MSRFNLLDEPWISVILLDRSGQREVSVRDVFMHAQEYRCLAGEMETQNFAVLRLLLSIVQTVFSRFDADGRPYPFVNLDQHMRQSEPVDEDDAEDYAEALEKTWEALWKGGAFPEVVCSYLENWRERFYLFDDRFPFYQVTPEETALRLPAGKKLSPLAGRNINRTISESNNKTALFSPVSDVGEESRKDRMTDAELARWMIMLQGYIGLSDKTGMVRKDQKPSKGWLFDIGGLYLEGDSLYETLLMNYLPARREVRYLCAVQSPCWEKEPAEVLDRLIQERPVDNLAELYTNWSRAVCMESGGEDGQGISLGIAKLPAIEHMDQFLEPMTVWLFNKSGDAKNHYMPRKHRPEQAMWRSFGLITLESSEERHQKRPEILEQFSRVKKTAGDRLVSLRAVSMRDDGNATSWVPVDEITDVLRLNDLIITDTGEHGWVVRISAAVEETKEVIETIYRRFLENLSEIRGRDRKREGADFISKGVDEAYQQVGNRFQGWLEGLKPEESVEAQILQWRTELKRLMQEQGLQMVSASSGRDLTGISKDGHVFNAASAHLMFQGQLKKKLG